ncbi:MAG: DNA recombination protein RmuC [bacterium]|nr:DNA recombination protein RmuC [bacterium]
MDINSIIITIAIIVCLILIRIWLNKIEEKTKTSDDLVEWLKDIGRRVDISTQNVDLKLSKNMELFNDRLDKSAYVIAQVQKNIGEFSEIGRSMRDLQEFIQSPKLRGNIGEQVLRDLLAQHFPQNSFMLQYAFSTGEKVDAAIKTAQGIIPIDSKFPMENFRKLMNEHESVAKEKINKEFERDIKKHIQDISKKYIRTDEGTVDYAIMYIPSESVYYEIINNSDLFDYAGRLSVLPVSPMSFYAYMKAILMSFEGQRIQTQAKEILQLLQSIKKDYEKTEESFSILNKHITNAYNQSSHVTHNVLSLGQKLSSTRLISAETPKEKLVE